MARTPKVVEDRREQIIDAAMRVFAEKGFARASNRDVAREARITTGLIYYYFKSKEALLQTILDERSPVQAMAQMSPEMLEQPPEVFLPLLIMRVLDMVESEQLVGIIRMMLPEILHNPEVTPIALGFFHRVLSFIGNYLKIQVTKGTVRADSNPEMVVQLLVSSLIGFILRRQIIRDPSVQDYTHAEIAQAVVDTFLQGIQAH